jgi:hypothetical protein
VAGRAKIRFYMKLRRSRARAVSVVGVLSVLAGDVAGAEASAGGVPDVAAARAKTRAGHKSRKGDEAGHGPAITFSGFHAFDDGSSRIFVKLTTAVPVEARYSGKKIEYIFRGAKVPIRNNKNPLLTTYFGAQVVSARFVQDKKGKGRDKSVDARFEILLREESKPPHKVEKMPDGTAIFTVDLPKPSTPPPPAPDPVPPQPKKERGGE